MTYALNYTCHPDVQNRFDDVRTVLTGYRCVKDVSDVICHFDSLMTADMRRGKDTCRNPNGGKGRVFIVGKDGKTCDATEVEETPIPYKPLEIK